MASKEEMVVNELKTKRFADISEVKERQVRLQVYQEIRAEIQDKIRRGKAAREQVK